MIQKIDHLGIAVRSLEDAIAIYEKTLGLKCHYRTEVPEQKARMAFFDVGGTHLELLEPTSEDSPIAKFLARSGEGIHHIAYLTDNIISQLEQAAHAGCRLVNEKPTQGASGMQIAFLHPRSMGGVLTELCARPDEGK